MADALIKEIHHELSKNISQDTGNNVRSYSNVTKSKSKVKDTISNKEQVRNDSLKNTTEIPSNLSKVNDKVQIESLNKIIHINNDIASDNPSPGEDGQEWQTQKQRRRRATPLTTGSSASGDSLKGVVKRLNYHVARLHPDTNIDTLKNHLITKQIPDVIIEQLKSKHPDLYSSFKVSIPPELQEKLLSPTTWPMGCLRNKFNLLEAFLQDTDIQIVGISEHWLSGRELTNGLSLGDWKMSSAFSRSLKIHGGVLILTKSLTCDPVVEVNNMAIEVHCEVTAVLCRDYNLVVTVVYRSPSGDFSKFLENLEGVLVQLSDFKDVILCGDFNVYFNTCNAQATKLCNLLSSFGYVKTIQGATRKHNCIDNIFINFSIDNFITSTIDTNLSDHLGQSITVLPEAVSLSSRCLQFRPITSKGRLALFNMLTNCTFNYLNDTKLDINTKFDLFFNNVYDAFKIAFPEKTVNLTKTKSNTCVKWFTGELRTMRNNYQLIHELHRKYGTINLLVVKRRLYSAYKKAIKNAKIAANNDAIKTSSNPIGTMWNIVNFHRYSQKRVCSSLSANDFNVHFANHSVNIVKDIPCNNVDPIAICSAKVPADLRFSFNLVSPSEVRNLITSIKNSNSKDIFGLSADLIKSNVSLYTLPLVKLINYSFEAGVFPDLLKIAAVVPIHKKGDVNDVVNYRPVSILPVFSKIFEKAIFKQINWKKHH
ncbi:uncharacterized protein LOC116169076 [Photinus pyralis]|uniref:uncharacterized protein LOC116169076 n=1 Tax=Photinus pyralis TaxID=7054 RepID=UPI001266F82C|nr:uncharacterized protein LOC116169076 [Photinus pyralis]